MSQKQWKWLVWGLLAGSLMAAVKLIFVDYTLDEEYQILMAYRRLQGDSLFGTMWEPHQTSAFFCTILMWPFVKITGDTAGVVIYLRICTTIIQALLSLWLYRVLVRGTEEKYSLLMALCYFNFVPKMIEIPEFSNQQLWFFTVIVLALAEYMQAKRGLWLVVAGIGMSLEVLAYPACLILFPFFCLWLFAGTDKETRLQNVLTFAGTCGGCAMIWLLLVLRKVTLSEFLRNFRNVIQFDSTHELSVTDRTKTVVLLGEMRECILLILLAFVLGFICYQIYRFVVKRHGKTEEFYVSAWAVFCLLFAEAIQLFYWVVLKSGYERPQIVLPILLLFSLFLRKEHKDANKETECAIIGSVVVIFAVVYMSDLGIWNALAQGILGALMVLPTLLSALQKEQGAKSRYWIPVLLCSLVCINIFGKGFTIKAGRTETNTIMGINNIIRNGPAKGILTHYMLGYSMDCNYEDFTNNVETGEKLLIVSTLVDVASTTPYMFDEYEVCHFSVVDPTTYDEKLLTYWELYPEKQPEVIAVDCWYGQLMVDGDSWIMNYIENDFGYTEVVDGRYMRFYKR